MWSTYGQFANGDRAGAYADTLLHDFGASFDHVIVEDLTTGTKHVITTSDGHEIAHTNDN